MSIVTGCKGLCLNYDGETYLIKGIKGNPFIEVTEYDASRHERVTKQVFLPEEMVRLLDAILKRHGVA